MDTSNLLTGVIIILLFLVLFAAVILLYRKGDRQETRPAVTSSIPAGVQEFSAAPDIAEVPDRELVQEVDDLEKIEGIGPVIARKLSEAGITTFRQLADTETEHIESLLLDAGVRLVDASTWGDQARLAAEGRWDEFADLQRRLTGGRRA